VANQLINKRTRTMKTNRTRERSRAQENVRKQGPKVIAARSIFDASTLGTRDPKQKNLEGSHHLATMIWDMVPKSAHKGSVHRVKKKKRRGRNESGSRRLPIRRGRGKDSHKHQGAIKSIQKSGEVKERRSKPQRVSRDEGPRRGREVKRDEVNEALV